MSQHEIRIDPLSGLKSIIAAGRAERPGASYNVAVAPQIDPQSDPFLAGHEDRTPPELYALRDNGGPADSPGWLVRVIPNLYPAVVSDAIAPEASANPALFSAKAASGAHEVIVQSPAAVVSLAELESNQLQRVVETWQQRIAAHRDSQCVHLIVNERREAGASLPHTHAQLYALPFVPAIIARERERFRAYATENFGANLVEDIVAAEIQQRKRLVTLDATAVLVTSYAPKLPYHLRIFPRDAKASFAEANESNGAQLLGTALRLLTLHFGATPPLNIWVRTAPRSADHFSWRIDILPRLSNLAGLELGADINLCTVSPESAAEQLRKHLPDSEITP